ncbi:histone H1 [Hevea brasiliensis]|uniref:histone H1 n=1 Tax=Hevea brasiliensis TaxID=3981 RepID=UPI0025E14673|nr:histone H1 [Hevea brasiliensis]
MAVKAPEKAKAKASKDPKSKKTSSAPKKPRAYPPYSEMIKEAIVALKERTGSSQVAIAKFIEGKQNPNLPANFKKLLLIQLKKLVADGKLVKVKNSFKLPPKATSVSDAKASAKPKEKTEAPTKPRGVAGKQKAAAGAKPKKAVETTAVKSPGKKAAKSTAAKSPGKKGSVSKKKTPVKVTKKPKSIKSPAKKVTVKKAKK